jgi:L-aspartate oxidase
VLRPRLPAPPPGWTVRADVVVVGSGIAGLSVALRARRAGLRVLLVTKAALDEGSTRWAQGGIAAALAPSDSPDQHLADTLVAGAGLCDPDAAARLAEEGPARVRDLLALGARFDADESGGLALTREGGHLRSRVAHAGGDATGAEVSRALLAAVADAGIETVEHALVLDLLLTDEGRAAGVTLHVLGEGTRDGVGAVLAPAVVLAAGGMGQVYASTTNPVVSTGDGLALALRAGAEVADAEFVQFHPTALWLDGPASGSEEPRLGTASTGQQPLVSEAMRGEGAVLVDAAGRRVLAGVHPLADLAPRDVVTKAMTRAMADGGTDHLFLDARALGEATLLHRFPTIVARCRAAGIDPVTEPIPVAPAAHYASGGVRTDLDGRTSLPGLYACGEVACTGVHGANRLASNSLLEGLVFAARIAEVLPSDIREVPERLSPSPSVLDSPYDVALLDPAVRTDVAQTMTDGAGVLRSAESLRATGKVLATLGDRRARAPGPPAWEASNLALVAETIRRAAALREESRGCHWREDFVEPDDAWRGRLVTTMHASGRLAPRFEPLPRRPPPAVPQPPSATRASRRSSRGSQPSGGAR